MIEGRYIPAGSTKIVGMNTDAVVYMKREVRTRRDGSTREVFSVIGYHGKARKSDFCDNYSSQKEAEHKITSYFEGRRSRAKMMADIKAANTAPADTKVGDIYVWSGGYNMTHVDFYQVTKIIGKRMIEVCQIGAVTVREFSHYQGEVVASVDGFIAGAEVQRRKVTNGRIKIDAHQSARRWDGKPVSYNHCD